MENDERKDMAAEFLGHVMEKHYSAAQHLDTQINILVGVALAIVLFSLSYVSGGGEWEHNVSLLVLAISSALSGFTGLLAVHPPRFMRKRGQEESVMYNRYITSRGSAAEYEKELSSAIESEKTMVEQYAREIYNLCTYYYRPKRKLFHAARNILVTGVVLTVVTLVLGLTR